MLSPRDKYNPNPDVAQMPDKPFREVVIVRNNIPLYRSEFYNELKYILVKNDVNLRLLYSNSDKLALYQGFDQDLRWAELVELTLFPKNLTWQPVLGKLKGADLVILEDASRNLLNYALFLLRPFGGPRFALWGHGWNHTDPPNRLAEWLKGKIGKRSDWYFAYTAAVRNGLIARGYDGARISNVQNCLPAPDLDASDGQLEQVRAELGLPADARVGLFCGRMYASKRLEFLLAAAERVHERLPSFHLLLGGGGPDQLLAEDAARRHAFVHYLGPLHDPRKAAVYGLARLVAMPGLVGLALVDAFQHHVPLITTTHPYQAPEIDYLEPGVNGMITEDTVEAFAQGIYRLAMDDDSHAKLVAGCQSAAQSITFDDMVRRFADGILAALDR
jgi:glycosyltransferase involved in cell wall biosynthesis